jgi:signal transduction histidine kinase
MTAGKVAAIIAGGSIGAATLGLSSIVQQSTVDYYRFLLVLLGTIVGLVVAYALVKLREKTADLEKQLHACDANVRTFHQNSQLLAQENGRVKEAATQAQILYEQVFDTMSSGVLVVDSREEVLFINQPGLTLLGFERDVPRESLRDMLVYFSVGTYRPISEHRSTTRITLGNGTSRLFGFSTSPLGDNCGRVIVFQDITLAIENQERKKRSGELALVGEMVSRLSHEIKNPLASILMGVKTLQRGLPESSQHGHILHLIWEEVSSLMRVISGLLESARPRTFLPGPIHVDSLLEKCADTHGSQAARQGIRLEIIRFPVPTVVLIDEQSTLRVMDSLIQNALDACSKGGVIRIGWREFDRSGQEELVPGFSGRVASIFVEDNGSGIPEELSATDSRIFEAFVSTKVSGSGLGLTVARDIIEEQGGVIVVSSHKSKGTKVEILLPIPENMICWNGNECTDCSSCRVKSSGMGYFCWKQTQADYHADTGQWPDRCLNCNYFRTSSLAPFFKSKLFVPRVEE